MSRVTYMVGELEVTARREWSALDRANAVCELQHGHEPGQLAALALLSAIGASDRWASSREITAGAADLLAAGWSPGDPVRAERAGGMKLPTDYS